MPGQKIPNDLGRLKVDQDAAGNYKQAKTKKSPKPPMTKAFFFVLRSERVIRFLKPRNLGLMRR
jgi:hypothetical protein